ncbi:MAG: aminotransferase III, partial [Candidatus Thermoplasmatota archaeon]
SQPVNLSLEVCRERPDIIRVDGGLVSMPVDTGFPIPGLPKGMVFACIAEVIMQAMENEQRNHVGSIDLGHLRRTEQWAEKYGFMLNELTSFGRPISIR